MAFTQLESTGLFFFEALAFELQRSAVFRDRSHHIIRNAARNLNLDFHGHRDFAVGQAGKMLENFIGDGGHIPADASRVHFYASEEMCRGCGYRCPPSSRSFGHWRCAAIWRKTAGRLRSRPGCFWQRFRTFGFQLGIRRRTLDQ